MMVRTDEEPVRPAREYADSSLGPLGGRFHDRRPARGFSSWPEAPRMLHAKGRRYECSFDRFNCKDRPHARPSRGEKEKGRRCALQINSPKSEDLRKRPQLCEDNFVDLDLGLCPRPRDLT